jgi:hypothetical protein
MPTERELIDEYKSTKAAAQPAVNRFLSECFTETLLVRDNVSSTALAAHFAAKLVQDENTVEILSLIALDYLKAWVESESEKIARARKIRFTAKVEGTEIFDQARLAYRDQEASETRKKVDAWKSSDHMRHVPAWAQPEPMSH